MKLMTKLSGNLLDHVVDSVFKAKREQEEKFLKMLEGEGLKIVRVIEIQNPLMSVSGRNVDVPVEVDFEGVRSYAFQYKVVYEDDYGYLHMLDLRIPITWRE